MICKTEFTKAAALTTPAKTIAGSAPSAIFFEGCEKMNVLVQIIVPAITFLLGYFAEKLLDLSVKKCREAAAKKKARKMVSSQTDILITAVGYPFISPHQEVKCTETGKKMYLAFPEERRSELPASSGTFETKDELSYPIHLDGVEDTLLKGLVEKNRSAVAECFINRTGGMYFNGEKYGISYFDGYSRTCDEAEKPILTYRLYKTDYFTHSVLQETIKDLSKQYGELSVQRLNTEFAPFRTSMGVSIIVELPKSNQIILTQRARSSSYTENAVWYYVSATEAFSETDYDSFMRGPSLLNCIKRGVLEELNINSQMYDEADIKIYAAFFEKYFFQDGLVAKITLHNDVGFETIAASKDSAKDSVLEVGNLFVLENSASAISGFIRNNRQTMRAQTIFALECHMARL